MKIEVEMTDTFGGEANYCWVQRASFEAEGLTNLQIMRKAKKLMNLNGVKCKVSDFGDMLRLDVVGACVCAFISWGS